MTAMKRKRKISDLVLWQNPLHPRKIQKATWENKTATKNVDKTARVGYAPPVWKRAWAQTLKESRLTIRGDMDRCLVSSEEVWTTPPYSPRRLVRQSAMLKERYVKTVEGTSTRPMVISMITGSYSRRRRHMTSKFALHNVETNLSWTCLVSGLLSFEHPSVLLFCPWSSLVCRLDHRRRPRERFLPKHILETEFR